MSVGAELKQARERLDLSLEDISSRTKISVERLTDIEEMNGAALPPLVYLQGYLKTYASEVQLDPHDIASRYLDTVEIAPPELQLQAEPVPSRAVADLDLVTSTSSQPQPITPPTEAFEAEARRDEEDEPDFPDEEDVHQERVLAFASDDQPHTAKPVYVADDRAYVVEAPSQPADQPALVLDEPADEPAYVAPASRAFAIVEPAEERPLFGASEGTLGVSRRRIWPMFAAVALAVAAGMLLSANLDEIEQRFPIFRSNDTTPDDTSAAREEPRTNPNPPTTSADPDTAPPSASTAPPDATRAGADGATVPPPVVKAPTPSTENESEEASKASAEPEVLPASGPISRDDLTGTWSLVNRVESSSLRTYRDLRLGFRLQLRQDGNQVTGTGEKRTENGKLLNARARTPITVEGTREGDRLQLRFTERGSRRASSGTITLNVADAATMQGSFESDAASAQGTAFAKRAGVETPR